MRFLITNRAIVFLRNSHSASAGASNAGHPGLDWPPPAKIQIKLAGNPKGHFAYDRFERANYDPKYKGNEYLRMMFKDIAHLHIVWGLYGISFIWLIGFLYVCYISFDKIEIWLDRRYNEYGEVVQPMAWEKIRDNYWKKSTVILDIGGNSHDRLPIMEKLQDQMLEKTKERRREAKAQE